MIHLTIDGIPVEVEKGTTILQAARQIGVEIPTLCYLEDVLPDGSCRLCVVEVTNNGTKCTEDFFHAEYICDFRTVSEYTDPRIKKCRRHHWKGSVFGALDTDGSMEGCSPCYVNFIQSVHSQRASYFYYMSKTFFCDSLFCP